MAEKLAELRQKGGKDFPDLSLPPDVVYTKIDWAASGTATIAVTKIPRFIVYTIASNSSSGRYMSFVVNVKTETAYRFARTNSGIANGSIDSAWKSYITSVSNNSITIKNTFVQTSSATGVVEVGIYY